MKNILIIGASRGIGLGFVRHLLLDKSITKIYGTHRNQASATELTNLSIQYADQLVSLKMDITNEGEIVECITRIQAEVKQLHLVINCVGILHQGSLQPEKSLKQINPEHLLQYFQVNSIGSLLLAKHLLPLLRQVGEKSILAVLSAKVGSIGDNQLGGWYGYRASKAALNMFMRNVAIEYRRVSPGTIVVMLHPGTTDTGLSKPFQKNVPEGKLFPVEQAVIQLLQVINNLDQGDSGQFFSWDGSPLPW